MLYYYSKVFLRYKKQDNDNANKAHFEWCLN